MKSTQQTYHSQTTSIGVNQAKSKLANFAALVKLKLSIIVVLSSLLAYAAVATFQLDVFVLLALGGMLITFASNIFNQVLERDYDALMDRTKERPLVTKQMSVSSAVLLAGLLCVGGLILLGMINPIVALLGSLSLMLYAFIYTPLKRYSTISVAIGAIPGALPVLIGTVAGQGTITLIGMLLFSVQFFWQFPHFWSIGYRSFEDYRKAGFELVPYDEVTGKIDKKIGQHSLLYSLCIVALLVAGYYYSVISGLQFGLSLLLSLAYVYFSFAFAKEMSKSTATKLMLFSFLFMPLFITIFILI